MPTNSSSKGPAECRQSVGTVPKDLCLFQPEDPPLPEVVLLAAFHAFLSRTNNQEVAAIAVQPSAALLRSVQDAASLTAGDSKVLVASCPPLDSSDTIATHVSRISSAVVSCQQPAGAFQAAVALDLETAVACAHASSLGLSLVLTSSMAVELVYKPSLCSEAARLMASHFEVFMSHLAQTDCAGNLPPLLHVPLMDKAEEQLVLVDFNQTQKAYDPDMFVHSMFAEHVKLNPKAPCVIFEGAVYSYAEIDAAANRIAHYLRNKAGAAPGDIIGVLVLRHPLMVATLLAVFKAGCGYLPLDHHHPEARLKFMLEDAAVKAIITQPDLMHKLPSSGALHTLLLHPESSAARGVAKQSDVPAAISAGSLGAAAAESPVWELGQLGAPDTTCYIIYTSGSTGKPKGVVVLHKGLTAYTDWFRSHFGITSSDVFIQKTPTNFDASVDELWTSLSAGAALVVAPPEAHRDVFSVMNLITRHGVTTASAVPSQVQMLAREILSAHCPADAGAGLAPCASLKRVLSGGEALTTTMAREVKTALPNCQLHNTYGPTETTVGITSWLYEANAQDDSSSAPATIPIGCGIHNSRLYVLDPRLQPVPVGVPGQLFISGVQVAAGYLNRKDLTDEVFVPNPFCEGPGTHTERMYRTGDLVRWLPGKHACIEFLGRVDHQVKLRGFRIELQEVEAALGALPGVRQAVTALVKNPATEQDHLVAWVSPKQLEPSALLQQLQGSLPEYMIPTAVVLMEQLPLLVSEKVDRKSLPAPDFSTDMVSIAPAGAPSSAAAAGQNSSTQVSSDESDPLTAFVSAVWGEVLGLQSTTALAPTDDFFALGGNSLLAGQCNSTLRAGLSLPDMGGLLIYQHTTLSAFVAALAELDPVVPFLPGLGADMGSSCDSSNRSNYFASLRTASYTSLSSSSFAPGQSPSRGASFTSQTSSYGAMRASQSSPSLAGPGSRGMPSALATAQRQSADMPRLETVFSAQDADAGSTSVFKQLLCSLSNAFNVTKGQQGEVGLPVAAVSGAAAPSLLGELPSLRTMLSASALQADTDKLPITTANSLKRGALDGLTAKLPSFSFEGSVKVDQDRPISRSNSISFQGTAWEDQHDPHLQEQQQQQQQVRPSLVLATIMQLFSMCTVTGISAVLGLAPMLVSMYLMLAAGWRALVFLPVFELGGWLVVALWSVTGKWALIGRYKECEAPLWGSYHLRHWVAHLFVLSARQSFVPLIRRTNLLNWFYRALGVRVGRNVVIDTDDVLGHDLIELQDDCILDASCGVSAITFEAGKPSDKHPLGTMRVRPVCVGERAVVGPNAMVTPGRVAPDSVLLPCSANSNPPSVWHGSSKPTFGPDGRAAVNTQERPLGVVAGLAAMWITSFLITLLSYPVVVGYWQLFVWLTGTQTAVFEGGDTTWDSLARVSSSLECWVQGDSAPQESADTCSTLMQATVIAMLVLPATAFISGQLLVVLVIPFKWLLRSYGQHSGSAPKSWWQRFKHHLQQCILDHPTVKTAAFLWTGTALFNAWLRALGAKVGKQAWIGEDLHLAHHKLVEIGDAVSICSGVSLLPSAALGAAKIKIMGGADVTNQTALYPGVTVQPGAVLGVFTYAEAGRTFPRNSITQGPMVLSPGQPDPLTPPATPLTKPSNTKPPWAPGPATSRSPAKSPPLSDYKTPATPATPADSIFSSPAVSIGPTPASTPARMSPTAALYKTGAVAADEPEPSEARLVSWWKYFRFNFCYVTLMCVLMPVHAVMLSAPFAVITILLMFNLNWWAALLLVPVTNGLQLFITIGWMALLKRILLPRCRGSHPFYTYAHTAWMVDGLLLYYQQIGFVRYISGSQLAVWYYRALGAKIGQGVLLNGLHSQEPDCLTIGDGTVIDEMTFIMAHTVENRCLKFHDVVVGAGVTIGCGSCVLPGCHIADGATMGDVSLLMKGETMPPFSVWKGVPAVPCVSASTSHRVRA